MDNLFLLAAELCFKLVRKLHFVDLYYNKATKRFERHPQNPRIRRRIHRTLFCIITLYSLVMLALPIGVLSNINDVSLIAGEYMIISFIFVAIFGISAVVNLNMILYQIQRRSTSKFLHKLFNKIIVLHEEAATLLYHTAFTVPYTSIHILLLLRCLLPIWICLAAARNFNVIFSDVIGFPIYQLVFFGNFMVIWKFLKFHQNLRHYIAAQEKQLQRAERCSEQCKQSIEPFLRALTLWWQSKKLLVCFLERFRWFEKTVASRNLQIMFLCNHFLNCLLTLCYICDVQLPSVLVMILDILLIALLNDTLKSEENKLHENLIIIVSKLTKRALMCRHCNELLHMIDLQLCEVNLRENSIQILQAYYWTRVCVLNFVSNLIIIGINMTQFVLAVINNTSCNNNNNK